VQRALLHFFSTRTCAHFVDVSLALMLYYTDAIIVVLFCKAFGSLRGATCRPFFFFDTFGYGLAHTIT
jgi:hypothetical protein